MSVNALQMLIMQYVEVLVHHKTQFMWAMLHGNSLSQQLGKCNLNQQSKKSISLTTKKNFSQDGAHVDLHSFQLHIIF